MHTWWETNKNRISAVVTIIIVVYVAQVLMERIEAHDAKRTAVICPSYLSIARSFRDTLIVMRNDAACSQYVLTHFD